MNKESILITGSSKGLGKELALTFARKGYYVIMHGRDEEGLEEVQKEIFRYGGNSEYIIGDLNLENTLVKLQKVAEEKDISILINNAGVLCPGLPFEQIPEEKIDDLLGTNLYSPIKLTQKIYPLFFKKNLGTIININSMMGLENKKLRSIACACKWGLRGFTDSLRLESEEKNISILGVYPTRIKTRPNQKNAMDTREVAEKIYHAYETGLDNLILDGRPRKYPE
ncbi:SDR family oxidoreductase [archaeon]|jgi:short-subunit dehydrogenase|nr:SDR family oxidoreductase [archaeon]